MLYDQYDFSKQIEYTFNLIFSIYGIEYRIAPLGQFKKDKLDLNKTVVISYGNKKPDLGVKYQIHIYASDFFGKDYLKPASMPKTKLIRVRSERLMVKRTDLFEEEIPVIYWGKERNFIQDLRFVAYGSGVTIHCPIDIIASIFFMVTRYEEVVVKERDIHNRFPAKASFAYKEGFLDRPVVNEYIELIWDWIDSFEVGFKRKEFWGNKDFAVNITHDIDSIRKHEWYRPPLQGIGSFLLKHKKIKGAWKLSLSYLRSIFGKDPYDTFGYMLSWGKKYRCKFDFFLKAGGNTDFDNDYWSTRRRQFTKAISKIKGNDCEIGLHPSYESYNDGDMLKLEKNRLGKVLGGDVFGCRQHYLRFEVPTTWRIQENAGFLYDTTLSFADHDGFRCGICLPFKPYDLLENRVLNLWEIPLTLMDGTLQSPNYLGLSPDAGFELIRRYIEKIMKCKGVFVLLWHNSSFDHLNGWAGWKKVYEKTMEYIVKQNALIIDGREIIKWWTKSI